MALPEAVICHVVVLFSAGPGTMLKRYILLA
jgi:hypothetical protein